MKTSWWTKLMDTIRGWLDRNSEQETHKPKDPEVITAPVESLPTGDLSGADDLNRPWENPATSIVIDAYEKNSIDWDKMARDKRVVGVIHRSAIGLNKDTRYEERKRIAIDRGYFWGAYHLGKRGNTIAQAQLFISMIDKDTLMALDLEDTSNESMMTVDEAVLFMNYVYEATKKVPVVYANHAVTKALNEKLKKDALFKQSKLWYARFKPQVTDFPAGIWKGYFLWQFSSEINCSKDGTCLYNVPGTRFDMDINVFFGSKDQLKLAWNNNPESEIETPPAPDHKPVKEKLWYEIAKAEIGQKEVTGPKHNQKILAYHAVTTLKADTDEVPWCSSFVSWCLENAGVESTKNAWARSYLSWGKKIETPVPGCVTVFKRGTDSGHVAFFVKDNGSTLTVLGGNQSNQVCYSDYKKSDLLGYRLPSEN